MTDTKSVIIFLALATVLLTGIGLLPKSEPIQITETVATPTSTVVHVDQTSDLALGGVTPTDWTVAVQKY